MTNNVLAPLRYACALVHNAPMVKQKLTTFDHRRIAVTAYVDPRTVAKWAANPESVSVTKAAAIEAALEQLGISLRRAA